MILTRKIRPLGLPDGVVDRERLHALFDKLLSERESVAVFAAAGSGKTVQAQLYADRKGWPLAWLTVDSGDRSGSRLLVYLSHALAGVNPDAPSVLQRALDAEFTLAEAAATLAESIGTSELLVVLDDCENIAGSDEAAMVLETFMDYLPPTARTLLLSREELDVPVQRMMLQGRVGRVTDTDLALDEPEARAMLDAQGQTERDPLPLLDASRGWIAAFAFEVRSDLQLSSEPDALASYLNREVLEALPDDEQRFLLRTSLLRATSPRGAAALCGDDGYALWQSLTCRHLPATLTPDRTLVYHPRFREFLLEQLRARYPDEVPELQRRHAKILEDRGWPEEAVEVLLEIDEVDEAARIAEQALQALYARADWPLVLTWLDAFGGDRIDRQPVLQGAKIRALYGSRRVPEAQALIRWLHERGRLEAVAAADPGVVAYSGWALQWRPAEALELIRQYPGDFRAEAVRYELEAVSGRQPVTPPGGAEWSDMERIVSWGMLVQGRLSELIRMLPAEEDWPPRDYYRTPHPLLGLVWRGESARARGLFDQVPPAVREGAHTDLWFFHEAWILWAEGDLEAALQAAEAAVQHSRRTRFGWEACFRVAVGCMLVALDRTEDARSVLADSISQSAAAGMRAYVEWAQTFQGLAFLRIGRPDDAARVLLQAVEGMEQSSRMLMFPLAAIYLSEAEWQRDDPVASQHAAERALKVAHSMEATFVLQRGLRDVPSVLTRQIDLDPSDDRWRRLIAVRSTAAAQVGRQRPVDNDGGTLVEVHTFGRSTDLYVNGVSASVRRLKVLELAAYLSLHPEGELRARLQEQLFPDADQRRGGNYYRQVVHKLRQATGLGLVRTNGGYITWPDDVRVDSTDLRFERLLQEASALAGRDRLLRLQAAVELADGPYLPESDLPWAEARRFELEVVLGEARVEAAQLALDLGEMEVARHLAEQQIDRDPYAETAYEVLMRVESAIGPPGAVLTAYQRLCDSLTELGVEPAGSTKQLLRELRSA